MGQSRLVPAVNCPIIVTRDIPLLLCPGHPFGAAGASCPHLSLVGQLLNCFINPILQAMMECVTNSLCKQIRPAHPRLFSPNSSELITLN